VGYFLTTNCENDHAFLQNLLHLECYNHGFAFLLTTQPACAINCIHTISLYNMAPLQYTVYGVLSKKPWKGVACRVSRWLTRARPIRQRGHNTDVWAPYVCTLGEVKR